MLQKAIDGTTKAFEASTLTRQSQTTLELFKPVAHNLGFYVLFKYHPASSHESLSSQ